MGSASLHISTPPVANWRLRVDWHVVGDRWHHAIGLCNDNSEQVLLKSLEGTPDQDWPRTAPIQECHQQHVGDGTALFGVGMAGSSHWSVAVELIGSALQFDYACRVNTVPDALGNTYQRQAALTDCGPAIFSFGDPTLILRTECVDVAGPLDQPAAELQVDREQLRIRYPIGNYSEPTTHRWRYRFALAPSRTASS